MANYIQDDFGVCPYCLRRINATYNKVINLTYRVDIADEISSETINTSNCWFCEKTFRFETEIFAFDLSKGFAIIVNMEDERSNYAHLSKSLYDMVFGKGYRLRFVTTCLEMIEKIRLFNLGIDDRKAEIIKETHFKDIMDNLSEHYRFLLTDISDDTLTFTMYDDHDKIVSHEYITKSVLDDIELPEETADGAFADFKHINNTWAKVYLNGGEKYE